MARDARPWNETFRFRVRPMLNSRASWLPVVGTAILVTGIAVTGFGSPGHYQSSSEGPVAIAGGKFQASAVVHVPGTKQFLFVDDDHNAELFVLEIGADGKQQGAANRVGIDATVTDQEGLTSDGRYFYTVGSQSKLVGFDGDGLVRFTYDPQSKSVGGVARITRLKEWLSDHVTELRGVAGKMGDHVLNIEGLAWDPQGQRLLLGLRAPVSDGNALIVPVRLDRPDAPFSRENLRVAGETITLPLGGAGIRSIEYDARSKHYLIITGAALNEETLDFELMEWDGTPGSRPVAVGRYGKETKPEGVTTTSGSDGNMRVLVFDTGLLHVQR